MTQTEFSYFYSSMQSRMTDMVRRFSKAASMSMDAEDIVQEAFVALWQLSESGYPVRNPEALLVRITKNICVGQYRKSKNRLQAPLDDTLAGQDSASAMTDEMDAQKIKEMLYEVLTKAEREYMTMKTDGDMSLDEIAAASGKSKPGIKTALSKARRKLLAAFNTNGYDE